MFIKNLSKALTVLVLGVTISSSTFASSVSPVVIKTDKTNTLGSSVGVNYV